MHYNNSPPRRNQLSPLRPHGMTRAHLFPFFFLQQKPFSQTLRRERCEANGRQHNIKTFICAPSLKDN